MRAAACLSAGQRSHILIDIHRRPSLSNEAQKGIRKYRAGGQDRTPCNAPQGPAKGVSTATRPGKTRLQEAARLPPRLLPGGGGRFCALRAAAAAAAAAAFSFSFARCRSRSRPAAASRSAPPACPFAGATGRPGAPGGGGGGGGASASAAGRCCRPYAWMPRPWNSSMPTAFRSLPAVRSKRPLGSTGSAGRACAATGP